MSNPYYDPSNQMGGPPQQYVQPGGYPGQNYGAPQQGQPQGPPQPVGAKGTVDGFFKQPQAGGGKGVSWKNKPDGYTYVGVVSRTPGDGDLFQDSEPNIPGNPNAGRLKTWKDGSPKMVMPVPLDLAFTDAWQAQEYADGEARVFLRGAMTNEFTRAMAEVGLPEGTVPQKGTLVFVTITGRKPGNTMAANQYGVRYLPAGTWEQDPNYAWIIQQLSQRASTPVQAPPQAPYQVQAPSGMQAPAGAPYGGQPFQAAPNPQQYAAPQYGAPAAYDPNQTQYVTHPAAAAMPDPNVTANWINPNPQQGSAPTGPAHAPQPQPQYTQPVQSQLPGMPPHPPVPPQGMPPVGVAQLTPEKQALLANVQGNQQAGQPPQGHQ